MTRALTFKTPLLWIWLIALPGLCAGQAVNDPFEQRVCNCIYAAYDSAGTDLRACLLQFEQHLVQKGYLQDTTGASYVALYQDIVEHDNIRIPADISLDSLQRPDNFHLFGNCFHSLQDDAGLARSDSKLKKLYTTFDTIYASGVISPGVVARGILQVLDASDFEKELYRLYALQTLHFTATPQSIEVKLPDADIPFTPLELPDATITLTREEEIFMGNEKLSGDQLADKLNMLLVALSDEQKRKFKVMLQVDKEVKMGMVADVQELLRDAGITKIYFSARD